MTCTPEKLTKAMNEFYNGSMQRYRHPLNPRLIYTEGMKAVADTAEAYWLIDMVAFQIAPVFAKAWLAGETGIGIVKLNVPNEEDARATVTLSLSDDAPPAFSEELTFTTFPRGEWNFYLGCDQIAENQYVTTLHIPQEY